MAENKLEFIIKKDSAKADVELSAMSIEAAKAFSVLLNSMIKIVELNSSNEGLRIKVESGSAIVATEGSIEQIEQIHNSFNDIINYKSDDKALVNEWRSIQRLISANGLEYEANFYTRNQKKSVVQYLKSPKALRAKPIKKPFSSAIQFMSGKLMAVGGTNPNIHLEDSNSNRFTISCTEQNAKKANKFLYDKILISCWVKIVDNEQKYELCDSYWNNEVYNLLQKFIEEFVAVEDEIAQLKMLHYRCRDFLDEKNYGVFRKFLRLFIHESTDVNILKTLLIVTQSFKEHDRLGEMREPLRILFDKKIKEHRRKLAREKRDTDKSIRE